MRRMVLGITLLFGVLTQSAWAADVIGFNAEDGVGSGNATVTLGSIFSPLGTDGDAIGGEYITVSGATGSDSPGSEDGVANYGLTFPVSGTYDFYARIYVGPSGGTQDSFFYGNGFGAQGASTAGDWITVNNLFTEISWEEYVWVNLSEYTGVETPITFTVPSTNLTQTLQIGGREGGLRIDCLAFALSDSTPTTNELDASGVVSDVLTVTNTAATLITTNSACLNASLTATGSAPAYVMAFWGTADPGLSTTGWDGTNDFGLNALPTPAAYSLLVDNFAANTTYFYRYYATNTAGQTAWSGAELFKTWGGAPGVTNLGATAGGTTVQVSGELTNGASAYLWIAYGEDAAATAATNSVGLESQGAPFSTPLAGLVTNTLYYCKWIASNANGVAESEIKSFTTGNRYFVTPGGAGTLSGLGWDNAFDSIQDAVDAAGTNLGEIYLKSGTYSNTATITIDSANGMTIAGGYVGSGDPGVTSATPSVITRISTNNIRLLSATNAVLTLERLTFAGGYVPLGNGDYGAGLRFESCPDVVLNACTLSNNVISCSTYQLTQGGALGSHDSDLVLNACVLKENQARGGGTYGRGNGGAVYVNGGSCVMKNSELSGNRSYGGGGSSSHGGAVYLQAGSLELVNCLVFGNDASAGSKYGDGVAVAGGNATMTLCTVMSNGGKGVEQEGSGALSVSNSILWDNVDDVVGTVSLSYCNVEDGDSDGVNGCISVNPMFERGLYLATGSLCIDAGVGTATANGVDDRTTRANGTLEGGTVVDLGYHFTAGMNTTVADLYVAPAPTGDDALGDGSSGTPWRTITKALSVAENGTRVHVAAGVYSNGVESMPLSLNHHGMQLIGAGADVTELSGEESASVLQVNGSCGDSRIEGLTIANGKEVVGNNSSAYGVGLHVEGSTLVVASCNITNNTATPTVEGRSMFGVGIYSVISSLTVTNCLVQGNAANGGARNYCYCYGGGVYAQNTCRIFDSEIALNTTSYATYGNDGGGGIYMSEGELMVRNALIRGNRSKTLKGDGVEVANGAATFMNVTIADNGGEGLGNANGTVTVDNSILWGNGVDVTGTVTVAWSAVENVDAAVALSDCISVDPLFVDASGGDYHLQSRWGSWHEGLWLRDVAQSPAIDAGDPDDQRWENEPESNGKRINMGAYGGTAHASLGTPPTGLLLIVR